MSSSPGLTGIPQPPPRVARQEVAPKGGYSQINVARNVPHTIGRGAGPLLLGTAAVMMWGYYRVGTFNVKRRYGLFIPITNAEKNEKTTERCAACAF